MLEDYVKAVPELTILPENQQYLQIREQEGRISELEKSQAKIKDLEKGLDLLGGLFAEQLVKYNIRMELDHPTHHHSKAQIKALKKYSSLPPPAEAWDEFVKWGNIDPNVLTEKKSKVKDN
ncbi:MAG: hypothetical protein ACREBU_01915 [Nitrososphaera sp.]